ncbi:3-hydroxyacyl-CoA dehydrogenase NAD-binding domain-containing protein [Pigmentiphaga soli]
MARIIVVGTGIMGCGIAAGFAAAGAGVALLGRRPEAAERARVQALELAGSLGGAAGPVEAAVLDGWQGWDGADLVIESVSEDLAVKQALFAQLDALVPAGVPIGSNSSGYPISRIAGGLATRARMFGTHYFMPAHLVPLVEVVMGADSDAALAARVVELFAAHGKKPVLVRKDIPGFLANRIQHALMREALALIDEGVATFDDVDLAVRYSFGFRYAAIGPMLQKEISGWDSVYQAAQEIYPSLSNTAVAPECLAALYRAGRYGIKAGGGYRDWTPEQARELKEGYERRLQAAFKILG